MPFYPQFRMHRATTCCHDELTKKENSRFLVALFELKSDTMVNLIRWTPDKVEMYQMFEIFVDLLFPFKVDTSKISLTEWEGPCRTQIKKK